ncbi:hypothetical protein GCM10023213_27580 [Prosthecobacter algae]|uniref:Uncharacterized protein n=1 Tax=Prosthecobacter algae TaxID=1144682 RepID=A0ABP9P7P4_9BACT
MIESCYWKEELIRICELIRPVAKPKKWTEKLHCTVERDIMIGFFITRRMIELHKVSDSIKNFEMQVFSIPNNGKNVTLLNRGSPDMIYDIQREIRQTKKPLYISNQFIHAYMSFVTRDKARNWDSILVVSDFDRNTCIWRIPIFVILELFRAVANDYPHSMSFVYNPQKMDYDVT